jgi:hypothetical protein
MDVTLEQLEAEFAALNIGPGSDLVVLAASGAIALIERAAAEGYGVLGLDGFHIRVAPSHAALPDGSLIRAVEIQPDLAHSIDYSSSTASASPGAWAEALAFVREHAAFVTGFEVVLGDRLDGVAPA